MPTGVECFERLVWPTVRLLFVTVLLWSAARTCAAQQAQAFAVGATVGLSSQPQGDSDRQLGPGLGGDSVGGLLFVDATVSGRVTVGSELSLGAEIKGRQQESVSGGSNSLTSRHHDTIFSGVVKYTALHAGPAQVAAVLGAGLGWRHTVRIGTFRSDQSPFSPTAVDETLSNLVFATTVGFDGVVNFSPRTALVWTGRLHWLKDDDRDPSGLVYRGVASTIVRFGGGVQVRF
jgi:hypothetical protein